MTTLVTAITIARGNLQDTGSIRYSDADLTQYGNDALTLMAEHRPELFTVAAPFTCAAGAEQTLDSFGSLGLVDIMSSSTNGQVREFDGDTMDAFRPGWANDPPGAARQWTRQKGSKYIFYVYPPASAGMELEIEHVALQTYAMATPLDPRLGPYMGAIADYISGAAEARESESTGTQREQMFDQKFIAKIKGAK